MKLLDAEEMRALDRAAIVDWGMPGAVLMENAGRGVADGLEEHFGEQFPGPLLIVAGKGNNGGDGFVAARHLLNRGWDVSVILLADAGSVSGDARLFLDLLRRSGAEVRCAADAQTFFAAVDDLPAPALIVDAMLGTGLASAVRGYYAEVIEWINLQGVPVVAVDLPSGIDAGSGRLAGGAVQAELTVTFAAAKLGHVLLPAAAQVGTLVVVDIGIPAALEHCHPGRHRFIDTEEAVALLPERPRDGHKGTFGHLLVVAGSTGKSGAAVLAAEAGLRSGAGLTTLACPASLHGIFACKLTEVMTAPLADHAGAFAVSALPELLELCTSKAALVIGPGLGTAVATGSLLRGLLAETDLPVLLDADALNLCGTDHPYAHRAVPAVLTPHPGEMARLLGTTVAEVQADRLGTARSFATTHGVVLVLKGAQTVVAAPDGTLYLNGSGNPLLASGGTGDVLAGLIGGLLAQGLKPVDAAVLGVFWHGHAADRLRERIGEAGLLAGELSRELPAARRALETTE